MRPRPSLSLALGLLLALHAAGSKAESFESGRGTIEYKETVQPEDVKLQQGVRPATPAELEGLRRSAGRAPAFIGKYVPASRRDADLLENLDAAFEAWLNSTSAAKESAAEVEAMVGAAFGQYCIERLPVRWAVHVDAQGREFVLVGENPPSKSFPMASVRYRIEDRKADFIGALYEALVHLRKKAR